MGFDLRYLAVSKDCDVLGIGVYHDVSVVRDNDHLPTNLDPLERGDHEVVNELVVEVIFGLVKQQRIIAELQNDCE
ncbi:hypothetical protein D3C73_1628560 [compost metagenome]